MCEKNSNLMTNPLIKEFIKEFCNDHNGRVRFLRGIFYDEQDGAENIISFLEKAIAQTRLETLKDCQRKIDEYFKGLIAIPFPKLSKESLKEFLLNQIK